MRYLLLLLLVTLIGCENQSFESDKRQIVAKNEIRSHLRKARSFDVTAFKEDVIDAYPDTTIKHPLRYTLDFSYTDSSGQNQRKKGVVIFTPDGKSVLSSHIEQE